MSTEQNMVAIRRYMEEFINFGNYAIKDQVTTPDFIDHTPTHGLPPTMAGVEHQIRELRAAFPDVHVTIDDMLADADQIVIRFTFRGTHYGTFHHISPTGKQITWSGIAITRFINGRAAEWWVYRNDVDFMRQIGALSESAHVEPATSPPA